MPKLGEWRPTLIQDGDLVITVLGHHDQRIYGSVEHRDGCWIGRISQGGEYTWQAHGAAKKWLMEAVEAVLWFRFCKGGV